MSTFKPKSLQTGLDTLNNTYASQDYLFNLYMDNPSFDINVMQDAPVIYTPLSNNTVNQINNNSYTFINGDVQIFNTFVNLQVIEGAYTINPNIAINGFGTVDYKYFNNDTNDAEIVNAGNSTFLNLFNQINNIDLSIDISYMNDVLIFTSFDISSLSLGSISFPNTLNVGNNASLNLSNQLYIIDWTLLDKLNYINVGLTGDTFTLNLSNSLQTTDRMEYFTYILDNASISNQIGGKIIISSNDKILSGSDWTALVAKGWTYQII